MKREKDSKLSHNSYFKDVCFKIKTYNNKSPLSKIIVIPYCKYNIKSKFMFQIIKGISKSGKDNSQNGWILNMEDENKLFDFVNINYRDKTIIHTLSNDFDFSNLNKQEQEMILYSFNKESEDEIEINPNEKATILYSVRERKYESILNLKQKITGIINAKIIDDNNEEQIVTLSIKETMQILQKYSLLPDEILLNEDNSITFNGKAIFSLIRDDKPKLIINTEII
ncbi:hypothetical protein [Spiroplasma endosymbiont of Polydrusus pterygomalis]|uniref:hypothetical protein n=1 Tax=Spiroplasma endosymbiont of Polydrusus pterygomalis TaxID=3139327 RepID=UPI003CCAB94B